MLLMNMLEQGAFLTVKGNENINTMTIGWGMEGVVWGKRVFMALVREQRYTYEVLKTAEYFTVSIPSKGEMKEALNYFGTHSGRDENKYDKGLITLIDAKAVDGSIVKGCSTYFEAKIIYRQLLDEKSFEDGTIPSTIYRAGDYHTIYIGEILSYSEENA